MNIRIDELEPDVLSELGDQLKFVNRSTAVLSNFKEGDVVSVKGEDTTGVVTGVMVESFDFPVGRKDNGDAELQSIDASDSDPVYIIALVSGGMIAVDEGRLSSGTISADKGGSKGDVKELAGKAEEAAIYDYMSDPQGSIEELQEARRAYVLDHHEAALSGLDASQMSYEELVNVPGVDDPHVGFDSLPNGWTRKSVLQAWASLGGTWTSCRADMTGEIRSPERWCAALKDEVRQTELWRNRF